MVGHKGEELGYPRYPPGTNTSGYETVVYKYPFSNPLMQDHILRKWPFSEKILVTAFDLYRNDSFVQYLSRTGQTLREHFVDDLGVRRDIRILADTGIFEIEAKKARLDMAFNFKQSPDLSAEEIFAAYELIDPDLLIAPDEIILLNDSKQVRRKKIDKISNNLLQTVERFGVGKTIGTLQGIEMEEISLIAGLIADTGLKKIARGGILPLRKVDTDLYYEVLRLSEAISREMGITQLHAFGLYSPYALGDYFVANSYSLLTLQQYTG